MIFLDEKKTEYWNHFTTLKSFWGHGVTLKRLEKAKPNLWNENNFWEDILFRHNGYKETPEEMLIRDRYTYDHCFGNMAAMIYQSMITHKIIKH